MKLHTYCYHTTNAITRSVLSSGTIKAESMEDAAKGAAKRAGLTVITEENDHGEITRFWADSSGQKRNVYVLHDPQA